MSGILLYMHQHQLDESSFTYHKLNFVRNMQYSRRSHPYHVVIPYTFLISITTNQMYVRLG